jgi:ABC-type transport system substrate-binding protein/class 3 adenylate cyclase
MSSRFHELVQGFLLAVLVLLLASGTIQLFFVSTFAQAAPLFSVTLLVSSNQPVRQQYASIIANNMIAMGIDAKLDVVDQDTLFTRLFFLNSTQGALYDQGGYDMGFVGWVGGGPWVPWMVPVPDWRFNFDGRPPFLAPSGNNYALYNSTELNSLFDQLYASTDTKTQIDLVHKWQEIVFKDSPYAYIADQAMLAPRSQKWTAWGGKDVFNQMTFPDIQHYSGGSNYTLAATDPFNSTGANLDPAWLTTPYAPPWSLGAILLPIMLSGAGLLDVDSRDLSFYPALAANITSSSDGLDWSVRIRKGALWQSGVEITADDFVWTRWAEFTSLNPSSARQVDIANLGNVIDFTFLNGTTVIVDARSSSNETVRNSWWKAVDRYAFEFHLSEPYAFTREIYAGFAPLPKHIMEKFPLEAWDSQPFSTASGPYTYTWSTKQYGGTGSYTAVGPVGAGPYYLQNYDFTTNVATLKKFHQYWNATGLEALGQFTIETYKVVAIPDKTVLVEALGNGQIDQAVMRTTVMTGSDVPTLESLGVNVLRGPGIVWQELGFNMRHPVFGTGVDTPLGKSDPSMAAEAARHVRKAISHLIPRDQIVNELMGGLGVPLASFLGPEWGVWHNNDLKPDPYDKDAAAADLRAAGYTVGGISGVTATAQQGPLFWVAGGGVIAAVAVTSTFLVTRRRRARSIAELRSRTGFANLDELLLTVDQQVPKQDRVLATVMFTDLVGSTERAAKVGDREWQNLLGRHFDLIRKELDRFSGREVGTTGDGMLAVFAGPERAVRCACSVRDVVRSLGLEIRVGLHTGEVQLTKMAGLDHVAGIAVHIGARVASEAGPGEILVSSTTKDLITGSGIQFRDYGMRALKGVPGEWHIFAVTAAQDEIDTLIR